MSWPPDPDLTALWERLVADPDSASAFAAAVLPPLLADLARTFRRDDPDHLAEAVHTAVMAVLDRPSRYDPALLSVPRYLRMAARADLSNLRDKERRRARGRIPWEAVGQDLPAGNTPTAAETFADHPALMAVVEALAPDDRAVFDLMRDGERETAVFAQALGLADLPADQQTTAVYQAKDRIKARLKRAGRTP